MVELAEHQPHRSPGSLELPESPQLALALRPFRELAHQTLREWDFSDTELTLLGNSDNVVFRVDLPGGGRRLLRIHSPSRVVAEIDSELRWLNALRTESDLAVPTPVRTRAGRWICDATTAELPQRRACVLFDWLDGSAIPEPFTGEVLAELGALLARLHEHARRFDPGPGFVRPRMDAAAFAPNQLHPGIARSARLGPRDRRLCATAFAKVRDRIVVLGTDPDVFGLIHGDLHLHNCLRVAGRLAPIDFADCTIAPLGYDLAVPLEMAAERPDGDALEAALLAGYRSVRPIDPRTSAALAACRAARQIHLVGWLSDIVDNPGLAEWADRYIPAALADLADFTRR